MNKRVVIVHCWEGVPEYCWYPWVKRELVSQGFEVEVPAMPETGMPKQDLWVSKLQEVVGKNPDEGLFLVGHSVGCITILRYLESLSDDQKIGGAVLVAGFTDDLGFAEIQSFFEEPVDFARIKTHCPKMVAIHSDNDPYVSLKYADILNDKLGAEVIIKGDMGHFSGVIENEESCTELTDVVNSVIKLSGNSL